MRKLSAFLPTVALWVGIIVASSVVGAYAQVSAETIPAPQSVIGLPYAEDIESGAEEGANRSSSKAAKAFGKRNKALAGKSINNSEKQNKDLHKGQKVSRVLPNPEIGVDHFEYNSQAVGDTITGAFAFAAQHSEKEAVEERDSSPSGMLASGGRQITVTAYAYCLNGRTATGSYTGYGTVAVDPGVIPLGSKIYIPGYGWGRAADTGGSIYGNSIDIWLPSGSECSQWGVRTVTVTVYP